MRQTSPTLYTLEDVACCMHIPIPPAPNVQPWYLAAPSRNILQDAGFAAPLMTLFTPRLHNGPGLCLPVQQCGKLLPGFRRHFRTSPSAFRQQNRFSDLYPKIVLAPSPAKKEGDSMTPIPSMICLSSASGSSTPKGRTYWMWTSITLWE